MFLNVIPLLSLGSSPAPLAYDTSDDRGPVKGCLEVVPVLASVFQPLVNAVPTAKTAAITV